MIVLLAADPSPWWSVIVSNAGPILTGTSALVASIAALRGFEGKRHRTAQQKVVLDEVGQVKALLDAATKQRDEIAKTLGEEQKRCSEEATALRHEIERQNRIAGELMKMVRR